MVVGSYFGEIEILFKRRRDFSVVCEMDSELYYLSRYVNNAKNLNTYSFSL